MANVSRKADVDAGSVEVFDLDLDASERAALLADPSTYLKGLFADGHVVNRVLIDTRILNDLCPSEYLHLQHVVSGPHRSTHMLFCDLPE